MLYQTRLFSIGSFRYRASLLRARYLICLCHRALRLLGHHRLIERGRRERRDREERRPADDILTIHPPTLADLKRRSYGTNG